MGSHHYRARTAPHVEGTFYMETNNVLLLSNQNMYFPHAFRIKIFHMVQTMSLNAVCILFWAAFTAVRRVASLIIKTLCDFDYCVYNLLWNERNEWKREWLSQGFTVSVPITKIQGFVFVQTAIKTRKEINNHITNIFQCINVIGIECSL